MIASAISLLRLPKKILYRFYRRIVLNTRSFSDPLLERAFRRAYEAYGPTFIHNVALLGTFYYAGVYLSNFFVSGVDPFEPAQVYRLLLCSYLFFILFAARAWHSFVRRYRGEIYVGIAIGAMALTHGLAHESASGSNELARYYLSMTITGLFYIFATFTMARMWIRDTFTVASVVSASSLLLAYQYAGANADYYRMVLHFVLANILGSLAYIFFVRREKLLFLTQMRKSTFFDMRRKRDLLEVSDNAKLHFLATMSHEVRTPMSSIITSMSMLNQASLSENDRRHLRASLESANTLLSTLNDILDFAKINSNESNLIIDSFYPAELIEGVCNSFHSQLQLNGNSLIVDVDEDSRCIPFSSDRGKIRQVLTNLISNANKFTNEGEVKVAASVKQGMNGAPCELTVRVVDNGIGIDPAHIDSLFLPFYRASTAGLMAGTGLGLPISKRIIEILGGTITVESAVGKGSTFTFIISSLDTHDGACTLPRSNLSGHPPAVKRSPTSALNGRVLLIEDNVDNALVTASLFGTMGLECTVAYNGLEALQLYSQQSFDLVFMDCEMPVMNGIETSQRMRKLQLSRQNRTPIVGLTARSDVEVDSSFMVDDMLRKPYDLEALRECILRWIPQDGRS